MRRARIYVILAALLPLSGGVAGAFGATASAGSAGATSQPDLERWIASLSSADPVARTRAAEQILAVGQGARGALIAATHSDDPEIRGQAARLLLRLPWTTPADPPPVRAILGAYSQMDSAEQRKATVQRLSALPAELSVPPLLRLLQEEPAEDVRWYAAAMLRASRGEVAREKLREITPPAVEPNHSAGADVANAPLLYALGYAWAPRDARRSAEYYRRAIDAAVAGDTTAATDAGELDIAFNTLIARAVRTNDYPEAVHLLRAQAARETIADASDSARQSAGLRLLALHAAHGPFAGAVADVRDVAAKSPAPALYYAVSEMLNRTGHPLLGAIAAAAGWGAAGPAVESHYDTADFLAAQKWDWPARVELYTVLLLPGDHKGAYDAGAHIRLSQLAAASNDDLTAAREMNAALDLLGPRGDPTRNPMAASLWAETRWRYYRAARAAGDEAEAKAQMAELLKLAPSDPTVILHVTPDVDAAGHADVARKWFDAVYADAKSKLEAEPDSTEAMNNLAWLCARCNRRLDEAVALSGKAVAAEPENSAYLDTAAEAQFRAGHKEEAVRLESKALTLRPDDPFMQMQLERFEGKRSDVPMEPQ